jgi:hypothetical protein
LSFQGIAYTTYHSALFCRAKIFVSLITPIFKNLLYIRIKIRKKESMNNIHV